MGSAQQLSASPTSPDNMAVRHTDNHETPSRSFSMYHCHHSENMASAGVRTIANNAWSFQQPGANQHDTKVALSPARVMPPPQARRAPAGSTVELQSSHWGLAHPTQPAEPVAEDPEKQSFQPGTGKDGMT